MLASICTNKQSAMTKRIKRIFAEVAPTYELVNHVLTLGLDMIWRKKAARLAAQGGGRRWLDVCSGTGEMAKELGRLAPVGATVIAVDFSRPMLYRALKKARRGFFYPAAAELPSLPFSDETFDLVTISFAARNINTGPKALLACFREFHRVLKPGSRFVNLETSQPDNSIIRELFHLYIKTTVKAVGRMISGSRAGYIYLASTIPRFYDAPALAALLDEAGFGPVFSKRFLFGAAAIHSTIKPLENRKLSTL
jgi:demethylmenaquinone methyltransferase/2-methoxy-6-polyprenyl-1,4-benzoquinol methylase